MKTVNVHKAKSELSKLLAEVEAGEELIIARGNKPIARLVPFRAVRNEPRKPGAWKGRFTVPDGAIAPATADELGHWDERPPFGGFSE